MATNSRAGFLHECRTTMAGVDQNADQLTHVLNDREQLGDLVVTIDAAIVRQNYSLAQYQQATRDVEDAVRQSREMLTRIKNGVRAFYGLRSEKLQEFGMTVRRFVVRTVPKEKPPETSLTPSPAAASETDGTIQK